MKNKDDNIANGYFFVIHVHLWQIAVLIILIFGLIYFIKKNRQT